MFSARIADFMLPTEKFLPLLTLQFLIFDKVSGVVYCGFGWRSLRRALASIWRDPLAGDIEDLADIFQCPHFSIVQTKAQAQDVFLAVCQRI